MLLPVLNRSFRRSVPPIAAALLALLPGPLAGLIVVTGDNAQTATDPGGGVPWHQVARVTNAAGTAYNYGSAVYLGARFMLTANHVSLSGNHVTFDGVTTLVRDTAFPPVQVAPGVDLKVFRIAADPGMPGVPLYTHALNASPDADVGTASKLVGWGVGRNPAQAPPADPDANVTWNWGSAAATSIRRWGNNSPVVADSIAYSHGGFNYDFDVLVTQLFRRGLTGDDNHAALAYYDSGSALFQQHGGVWFLAGVPVTVSVANSSTFAGVGGESDPAGDLNFFARIASYATQILQLILGSYSSGYADWALDAFPPGTPVDALVPDADPNNDGVVNLLAYAFNLDPLATPRDRLPQSVIEQGEGGGEVVFRYRRNKLAADLAYTVQVSSDMAAWTAAAGAPVVIDPDTDGDGRTEVVEARVPLGAPGTPTLVRLSVELAP